MTGFRSFSRRVWQARTTLLVTVMALAVSLTLGARALALEPVAVDLAQDIIDLSGNVEIVVDGPARFQLSTAPMRDGTVHRIEVVAEREGLTHWASFALSNTSEEAVTRLLVVPEPVFIGDDWLRPRIGGTLLVSISASQGTPPVREPGVHAVIYRLILPPGETVTYVAELSEPHLPAIELWMPQTWRDTVNRKEFFSGALTGFASALAILLSVFLVMHPAALNGATALLCWAFLAFLWSDPGGVLTIPHGDVVPAQYIPIIGEAALGVALAFFLPPFVISRRPLLVWPFAAVLGLSGSGLIAALALTDPPLAMGAARLFLLTLAAICVVFLCYGLSGRVTSAFSALPGCIALIAWIAMTRLPLADGLAASWPDMISHGGLLVTIVLCAVTAAHRTLSRPVIELGAIGNRERLSLAMRGGGDLVWEWDVVKNILQVRNADADALPGLFPRALENARWQEWLHHLNPQDSDRLRACLDAAVERRQGRIICRFRLRGVDGHYVWYALRARPLIASNDTVVRCTGTLREITAMVEADLRLMKDAVRDSATGLANAVLFSDRLAMALARTRAEAVGAPTVMNIHIDRLDRVNSDYGYAAGEAALQAASHRISGLLGQQDTPARMAGNCFAVLLLSEQKAGRIAAMADRIRLALAEPLDYGGQTITVTASVGVAIYEVPSVNSQGLLADSSLARERAVYLGGDRVEIYRPALRQSRAAPQDQPEAAARHTLPDSFELRFQPVIGLDSHQAEAFSVRPSWQHMRTAEAMEAEFSRQPETGDHARKLDRMILTRTIDQIAEWRKIQPDTGNLFAIVQPFCHPLSGDDLMTELKDIRLKSGFSSDMIRLEFSETDIAGNPELFLRLARILDEIEIGYMVGNFGSGLSSLSHLHEIQPQMLCVAMQTIHHRPERSRRPGMLRSLVDIARNIGAEIMVDGAGSDVETEWLAAAGCHYVRRRSGTGTTGTAAEALKWLRRPSTSPGLPPALQKNDA